MAVLYLDVQLMLIKMRTTFFCAFLLALPLAAQISQATLSGTVRDSTPQSVQTPAGGLHMTPESVLT